MSELDELRALEDEARACSLAHPLGAPGEIVAALESRFKDLHARWVAAVRQGADVSLDEVRAEYARVRAWHDAMSNEERAVYFPRLRVVNHWYKLRLDEPPPEPPALRSAVGEVHDWLVRLRDDLVYASVQRESTTGCDCDAAARVGRPPTAKMTELGPYSDGYYRGDQLECEVCHVRWFRGVNDDSVASCFYERL